MRHKVVLTLIFSLFLVLISAYGNQLHAQPIKGTVITVNDVGDSLDAAPNDGICADAAGKCTLRAAIAESNVRIGPDVIIFDVPVPAVITLTLGELKTTDSVSILGRGARRLTIQRSSSNSVSNFRIFHFVAFADLRGVTIRNGSAGVGGGILAEAHVSFYDVAITGNAAGTGGGVGFQGFQAKGARTILERCLINSNTAYGQGGGIYISPGMGPEVLGSTVTGNSAAAGGAIANYGGLVSVNNTIARNFASQGTSSIVSGVGGRLEILNTIIGPDAGQAVPLVEGQYVSRGSNIVTNTTGSSGWTSSDQISTNNGIDPMLGNLADNGGQTDSIALLPGSPAINRGNDCVVLFSLPPGSCTEYITFRDQRKFERLAGTHVDVGAYESGSAPNSGIVMWTLSFGAGSQRHAYSRVTVINTETMERRSTFIVLRDTIQMGVGRTQAMSFERNGVYVAEIHTKRAATYSPQLFEF